MAERQKLSEFHYTSYDDGSWEVQDDSKDGNCNAKGRNESPAFAASLTQFFLSRFRVRPRFPIIIERRYRIKKWCWLRFKKMDRLYTETFRVFNMNDLTEFIDKYYHKDNYYTIFEDSSVYMTDLIELSKSK